jgi:hypothetical protein
VKTDDDTIDAAFAATGAALPDLTVPPQNAEREDPQPEFTQTASKIRALFHSMKAHEITSMYAVAELVCDEQQNGKYGDKAVEHLAEELQDLELSAKTLMNYSAVPKHFSKSEIDELSQRSGGSVAKPFWLTWTHDAADDDREGDGEHEDDDAVDDIATDAGCVIVEFEGLLDERERIVDTLDRVEALGSLSATLLKDLERLRDVSRDCQPATG